ncbi:MAG: NfeD family protein [Chloroflexota bacterium]
MSRAPVRRPIAVLVLALLGTLLLVTHAFAGAPRVRVADVTGIVDETLAGWLEGTIAGAERDGIDALVLRVDTPGGSLEATRRIVAAQLGATVPVLAWVGPGGARASSAGAIVVLASHLAGMAPGTTIGAATPVSGGGGDLDAKVRNDTIAWARTIAEARGRPPAWAEAIVDEARSDPAAEAVAAGAVEIEAATLADFLAVADGRTVTTAEGSVTLAVAGATPEQVAMDPLTAFLHFLSDPNIAFLLFAIGLLAILIELQAPNLVTGALGALAIILAFIGFGSLPLNLAGVLLVGLAFVLLVLELNVTSNGLLTIGGIVAFVLGAAAFYARPDGPFVPAVAVAVPVIAGTAIGLGLLAAGLVVLAARARAMPLANRAVAERGGPILVPGTHAEVRTPLAPVGTIHAEGEAWSARSDDGRPIAVGASVRVTGQDGLVMLVAPIGATMEDQARTGTPGGREGA